MAHPGSQVVLATAGYDHTIRFWEATSGICYRTLQYADSQVSSAPGTRCWTDCSCVYHISTSTVPVGLRMSSSMLSRCKMLLAGLISTHWATHCWWTGPVVGIYSSYIVKHALWMFLCR